MCLPMRTSAPKAKADAMRERMLQRLEMLAITRNRMGEEGISWSPPAVVVQVELMFVLKTTGPDLCVCWCMILRHQTFLWAKKVKKEEGIRLLVLHYNKGSAATVSERPGREERWREGRKTGCCITERRCSKGCDENDFVDRSRSPQCRSQLVRPLVPYFGDVTLWWWSVGPFGSLYAKERYTVVKVSLPSCRAVLQIA